MKKFVKGMNKDSGRVDQPENTYRDALNANLYYTKGAITNEEGTTAVGGVTMDTIGTIPLLKNKIVIFALINDVSHILLADTKRNEIATLYKNSLLDFQKDFPITGEFRVDAKNDTIIYFTDNYYKKTSPSPSITGSEDFNPPRAFNISRQRDYIKNLNGNIEILYSSDFTFDVHKLNIFPEVGRHSVIRKVNIVPGGAVKSGAYQLALCYSDENFLETDYFVVSNPVYVYPSSEETLPVNSITGSSADASTNKAIIFNVVAFQNNNYTFIQPAIIRTVNGSVSALKLERTKRLTSNGGKIDISYTGLEDASTLAVEDISIDKVKYDTAKSLAQLDNRLYLGNLRSRKDIGYQRFANQIKIVPIQITVQKFDNRVMNVTSLNKGYAAMLQAFGNTIGQTFAQSEQVALTSTDGNNDGDFNTVAEFTRTNIRVNFFAELRGYLTHDTTFIGDGSSWQEESYNLNTLVSKGYKNYRLNWKHKSYRRGEVYAFYISFILKNGSETYAYHIPGRAPVCVGAAGRPDRADDDTSVCEDTSISNTPSKWALISNSFEGAYPSEIANIYGPKVKVYQFADTSLSPEINNDTATNMAFWENENEKYPFNLDFLGKTVQVQGIETSGTLDLRGQNVRHHKMPSNLGLFSFVKRSEDWGDESNYLSWDSNQTLITDNVNAANVSDNHANFGQTYTSRDVVNEDEVKILGIQLENIRIPKVILSQVRGYKVYYAKRKEDDKTILGQSMAIPAHPRYASVDMQSRLIAKQGPYKKGFFLYGGLMPKDNSSMLVASTAKQYLDTGTDQQGIYVGDPVFTFHDFNLLRNKPDLTNATHVTCQYATVFRAYQGGPGVFSKNASTTGDDSLFPNGVDNPGKNIGTATRVTAFPSLGWIHPDLGNTMNFSVDGEVFDITDQLIDKTEDVTNPYGFATQSEGTNKRKRGKQRGIETDAADIKAKELMVRSFKGQVNVASAYLSPGEAMASQSVIKGGANKGPGPYFNTDYGKVHWQHSGFKLKKQNFWIYALDPNSKKYVQGKVNNSVPDAASFQGASILYNRGGESSLALGLISGLPRLKGLRPFFSDIVGTEDLEVHGWSTELLKWGDDNNWCFPDACRIPGNTGIPPYIWYENNGDVQDFPNLSQQIVDDYRGFRYSLEPNRQELGCPMAWMVNINSIKTDVFNPFDRQELVWTGYYKEIESVNLQSAAGGVVDSVDLETGDVLELDSAFGDNNLPSVESNYYDGTATSGYIFGGDTYINRYSFRTTSQSYGHTYFRGASALNDPGSSHSYDADNLENSSRNRNSFYLGGGGIDGNNANNPATGWGGDERRFQGDIPSLLSPQSIYLWGRTNDMHVWFAGTGTGVNLQPVDTTAERLAATESLLKNADNFVQGTVDPVSTIFSFLCESESNISLRHGEDKEKGVSVKFFDKDTASEVLFDPPTNDHTEQDKLLYNSDYSALNTQKSPKPYPKRKPGDESIYEFATRIIRSKPTGLFIGDKYREFLALDFKDLSKTRGDLWSIFVQNGILLLHTERSLFLTKGKEELQVSAATAFVGSGNIFAQSPSEALETSLGYGGSTSVLSGVSTPQGRFWVSLRDRKCYMFQGGVKEISVGMESWFRENIPFQLETYGINLEETTLILDAPTATLPFGFTSGYDPKYKRVLVTKKELVVTGRFLTLFNNPESGSYIQVVDLDKDFLSTIGTTDSLGNALASDLLGTQMFVLYNTSNEPTEILSFSDPKYFSAGGWTLSYYPELEIWGSRHSYLPKLYSNTPENFYSFNDITMWEHSNNAEPGNFYNTTYPFELEFIDNSIPISSKVFSSIGYWMDVVKKDGTHVTEYETKTYPGFTSFYVYNTTQISGISTNINYLSNARLVDKFWYINSFRDYSKIEAVTNSYINTGIENVVGGITTEIFTTSETSSMFVTEGVVNIDYVHTTKLWHERRRFVDHYLGVRLSNDNTSTNLVYLYAAGTKFRKSNR